MAVIDVITYHNEEDLFDLRYNILSPYVDEFVVVESVSSFGGEPKELNFGKIKDKYSKVTYYVNNDDYTPEEVEFARESPNTNGYLRWMHEFLQKESIQKAIVHLRDGDEVFIGDVDEIWDPSLTYPETGVTKLKLRVYTYYLNLRSSEEFWGTIHAHYRDVKGQCLNHLRTNSDERNTKDYQGWHFTNQGGELAIRRKLYDQYNPAVFGNETWFNLSERFGKKDYVGRDFTFVEDESDWPLFLKANREKYGHLLKN